MEKDNKKEYEKPELTEHENLNEITKGGNGSDPRGQTWLILLSPAKIKHTEKNNKRGFQ